MNGQYDTLYQLFRLYLYMAAWETPDFQRIDPAAQEAFREIVASNELFDCVEDTKRAVLRSGLSVPDRWLWPLCAVAVSEGRGLSDDTRTELQWITSEMLVRLTRLDPDAKPAPPPSQPAIDILHDPADLEVKRIAADATRGGNERMRAIIGIDARYAGKPSTWWAELLGVLDGTVRSYETWKAIQRQRKAAD